MTTTVGIKMLKANLRAYVSRAVQGEHIIIMDRGREVAELRPLGADRQGMWALVEAGVATWSGRKPTLGEPIPIDVDMAGAVIEDRR